MIEEEARSAAKAGLQQTLNMILTTNRLAIASSKKSSKAAMSMKVAASEKRRSVAKSVKAPADAGAEADDPAAPDSPECAADGPEAAADDPEVDSAGLDEAEELEMLRASFREITGSDIPAGMSADDAHAELRRRMKLAWGEEEEEEEAADAPKLSPLETPGTGSAAGAGCDTRTLRSRVQGAGYTCAWAS